jgi:hypothetical protein
LIVLKDNELDLSVIIYAGLAPSFIEYLSDSLKEKCSTLIDCYNEQILYGQGTKPFITENGSRVKSACLQ